MLEPLLCLLILLVPALQPKAADRADALVTRAIEAVGGAEALKRISALQIDAIGHDYFIDQSERPEGPFIVRYVQTSETRDVSGGRSRIESQQRFTQVPDWGGAGTFTIVDG